MVTEDPLEALLGTSVAAIRPVTGGCIARTVRVDTDDGRRLFVKCGSPPRGGFEAEARALAWLAEPGAVAVPEVVAVDDHHLALEWIEPDGSAASDEGRLGHELAALHRSGADAFGFESDGFVGELSQDNTPTERWDEFYVTRRLEPLVRRSTDRGHLPETTREAFTHLLARMGELVGDPEPPARLHGDLWAGNVVWGQRPTLVDPASYAGHREVDLAMMRLFGGFTERCFAAYQEAFPLAEGHAERVALYQLYPLLVHVVLFGGRYVDRVTEAVRHYR